jgi:hypothetical protein
VSARWWQGEELEVEKVYYHVMRGKPARVRNEGLENAVQTVTTENTEDTEGKTAQAKLRAIGDSRILVVAADDLCASAPICGW